MKLTDHEYRTLPRLANSDLSEFAAKLHNRPTIKASPATLYFGSVFHQLVLEPERNQDNIDWGRIPDDHRPHLHAMVDAANHEVGSILVGAWKEEVRQWVCSITGLLLKAKVDACCPNHKWKRRHIIDLKSTSCRSMSDFEETITEYHYDRQAAFYLSSESAAEYFEFVAVQKRPPYAVFRKLYHRTDPVIVRGAAKVDTLLRRIEIEFKNPTGWRPSSWSRKEADFV